jgi:hypothetical protein
MSRVLWVTIAAVVLLVTLTLTACGRVTGQDAGSGSGPSAGSSGGSSGSHPTGADDLLLRVELVGGFVAPQAQLLRFPQFSLYGDGTVVTEGAQIEIYPQPALPPLLATPVDDQGMQAILRAAQRAGLAGPDATYDAVRVPDAPDTVFTLNLGGKRHTVTVTALGMSAGSATGVPADERRARAVLQALTGRLADLRSWLPPGSVGKDRPYRPAAMRVFVTPGAPKGSSEPPRQPAAAWPLSPPLAQFGSLISTPLNGGAVRCGVVGGADLSKLFPLAQRANRLTPWTSDGDRYALAFGPLLPDESGC